MAFTIGTATFTNGSTVVTAVSLTSGRLSYFGSGTRMVVGTDPVVAEVEAIDAPAVNAITLREPWAFATGTYAFLANMTSEGVRDAAQTLRTYVDGLSVAPTADSTVVRDERGAVKAATAVDADDAVVLGQFNTRLGTTGNLGTAAQRNVGTSAGNVAEYTAGGLSGYGYGEVGAYAGSFVTLATSAPTRIGYISISATDSPFTGGGGGYLLAAGSATVKQIIFFNGNEIGSTSYNDGVRGATFYAMSTNTAQTIDGTKTFQKDILRSGNSGLFRSITYQTNGVARFSFYLNNAAESGANAGSDFGIARYSDTGAFLSEPFFIKRSTGDVSFAHNVTAASLSVSGSKNFRIDNPVNPDEYLYHSAIESDKPRTQYVLEVEVDETMTLSHDLPDWFHGLNGNTCTVFVSPCEHFGAGYGSVTNGVLSLTTNAPGKYHVLIMAERIDANVADWKLTEVKPVEPEPEPEPDTGATTDAPP